MKKSKVLVMTLCAVLLVATTVLGTMAYLTSEASVVNTFTVGKVEITLDEAKVNPDGTPVTPAARTDAGNVYHLIPGKTYPKDPIIHVDAASEDCYLFVKVENGIADYEVAAASGTIAQQITSPANGWTALTGVDNVYYQNYTKNQADKDFEVFAEFKVDGNANNVTGWDTIATNAKITVTGYAVQKEGFDTAAAAWTATFGAATPNP